MLFLSNLFLYASVFDFLGATLLPDFFLDGADEGNLNKLSTPKSSTSTVASGHADVDQTFQAVQAMITEELVSTTKGVYQFDLKGMYNKT